LKRIPRLRKTGRAFVLVSSGLAHPGSQITHPGALHNRANSICMRVVRLAGCELAAALLS